MHRTILKTTREPLHRARKKKGIPACPHTFCLLGLEDYLPAPLPIGQVMLKVTCLARKSTRPGLLVGPFFEL